MINTVILMGTLASDVDLRYTAKGTAVANLRVVNTMVFTSGAGKRREDSCLVDVTAWGKLAEHCAEYLGKGSNILLEGQLRTNEWEDQYGQKKSRLTINARTIQFLDPKGTKAPGAPQPAGVSSTRHPGDEEDGSF